MTNVYDLQNVTNLTISRCMQKGALKNDQISKNDLKMSKPIFCDLKWPE